MFFKYYNDTHVWHNDLGGGDPAHKNSTLAGNASTSGKVLSTTIENGGSNYATATAVSTLNVGPVASLAVTAAGTGYTTTTVVQITPRSLPPEITLPRPL